ncbi:MAG TPA: DUF4272 domain-containing protein [Terracidiphilus sp.]|nr:DUF4272 domain-containing protein [Terracidiphilus sp.]
MPNILDDDFTPSPPTPERVAKRALALAAVSCRGLIESDAAKSGAEDMRSQILPWLESVGAANELEPKEADLLSIPLGQLDPKTAIDASWSSEGMAALAWALGYCVLPPFHVEIDPADVATSMGFLDDRENTPVHNPKIRDEKEIDKRRNSYLTVHWRLRQQSLEPGPANLVDYVQNCKWAELELDGLEIIDHDLAINGVRIDRVAYSQFREVLSITQERHQALNWLLGFEELYSQVTTDT